MNCSAGSRRAYASSTCTDNIPHLKCLQQTDLIHMAKKKTAYVCADCGAEHGKWQGQCVGCGTWNTLSEFVRQQKKRALHVHAELWGCEKWLRRARNPVCRCWGDIDLAAVPRIPTDLAEFDRVLGGGLVPGSAVLIGGNPRCRQKHAVVAEQLSSGATHASAVCHRRGIPAAGRHARASLAVAG
jgi:hypothetical protein